MRKQSGGSADATGVSLNVKDVVKVVGTDDPHKGELGELTKGMNFRDGVAGLWQVKLKDGAEVIQRTPEVLVKVPMGAEAEAAGAAKLAEEEQAATVATEKLAEEQAAVEFDAGLIMDDEERKPIYTALCEVLKEGKKEEEKYENIPKEDLVVLNWTPKGGKGYNVEKEEVNKLENVYNPFFSIIKKGEGPGVAILLMKTNPEGVASNLYKKLSDILKIGGKNAKVKVEENVYTIKLHLPTEFPNIWKFISE